MKMNKPTALAALGLCCGFLVAFPAQPAAADMTACNVMTKSDVEMVLHTSVDNGRPFSLGSAKLAVTGCAYLSPDSNASATLEVGRAASSRFDTEERRYQPGGDLAAQGPPTSVKGVGSNAFFFRAHGTNQLDVYAKGYLIGVNTTGNLDQLKALAKRAIARL